MAKPFDLANLKLCYFSKLTLIGSLAPRIVGMALRLTRQFQDNGLVKYWNNGPGNIDL